MNLLTKELTGKNSVELTTEIQYFVASAVATGEKLIRLNIKPIFQDAGESRRLKSITRILLSIKQSGRIQLAIHSSDLNGASTESAYILNKHPEISELNTDENFFLIKL